MTPHFPDHRRNAARPWPAAVAVTALLFAFAAAPLFAGDVPTTGFEDSDRERYTTLEEEYALLEAVAAGSPRMTYTEIGTSVEGRPLHLVRLGHPEPPADDAIAEGRSILIIGGQHGNEPAGREGALRFLRDLAFTEDPEIIDHLSHTTVLIIPTASPDGRVADTRGNAHGVNTNRDHLTLETPEGRIMARIMRDFTPHIGVDAHEAPSRPDNPDQTARLEPSWPRNLNVHDDVRNLSSAMIEDHIFPRIEEDGYRTSIYGSPGGAGGGDERILRNMFGLRHSVGMLIESFRATRGERADLQVRTLEEVLRFHREHADAVAEAVERSRTGYADRLSEPFYLGGADWEDPTDDQILDPAPCGYLLNNFQANAIATHAELFPIHLERVSDDAVFVSMKQPFRTVIPLLLDERAAYNVVEGKPLYDCDDPAAHDPPPGPPAPSAPAQHFIDFSDEQAGSVPADWSMPWTHSDWTVRDDAAGIRHRVDNAGGRRALVWDEPGEIVGDVELYTRVRAESANTLFQLPLHVSGEAGSENAYYVDLRAEQSALRINRYSDGSFATLGSANFEPAQDTWYHLRFRREGFQLMARVWPDGEDEPDQWQVIVNDNTHHSGAVGFAGFQSNSVNDWSFLGVGVGGEPAPGPND